MKNDTIFCIKDFEKIPECYCSSRISAYIERLRKLKRPYHRLRILKEMGLVSDLTFLKLWGVIDINEKIIIRKDENTI